MRNITIFFILFMCSLSNAQNYTLSSLVVNGVNDNWCGDIEEVYFFGCAGSPDLFVEIYNSSNTLVYESSPTDNTSTLNLTLNLDFNNGPYSINLFDYDGISSNSNSPPVTNISLHIDKV